MQIFNVKNKK